jgi:hypothetical protein
LGFAEPATGDDDQPGADEAPPARRGQFPSSIGLSVLVPADATELRVTARWGDYIPREVGDPPRVQWDRQGHVETVGVRFSPDYS